jgi:biopolymer transport protein ExbD
MSGGSASGPVAGRRGKSAQAEPIDLDMTPMMNMLIILISFLVTMVVFTQLAVIKFDLPPAVSGAGGLAAGDTAAAPGKDVDITLVISEAGLQIMGEGRKLEPIPKGRDGYDFARLGLFMKQLKATYPAAESVVLLIDTSVVYQDIISAMDVCRDSRFPDVLLSGGVYQ